MVIQGGTSMRLNNKILLLICFLFVVSCQEISRESRIKYTQSTTRYGRSGVSQKKQNSKTKSSKYTGYYKIGKPYKINGKTYTPREYKKYKEVGLASWNGDDFNNKKKANGEIFNMNDLTAAHKTLPLPSIVKITNLENGLSVVARVNDRGPFVDNRLIDVSKEVSKKLEFKNKGVAKVKVELLTKETEKFIKKYNLK